jgi:hypothetical protein
MRSPTGENPAPVIVIAKSGLPALAEGGMIPKIAGRTMTYPPSLTADVKPPGFTTVIVNLPSAVSRLAGIMTLRPEEFETW